MVARILLMLLIFFGQKYTVCLELGSDPGIQLGNEGTIQPTTAAKVWQNQKYEEFITAREKTAREDL